MKKLILIMLGLMMGLVSSHCLAATLVIDQYPTNVRGGDVAKVQVTWSDVPIDKDYKLRVQLENWDVNPGVCVFKDIEKFSPNGTAVVEVAVPQNINKGPRSRFLAVFLSKSAEWDDALIVTTTEKNVNLVSLLNIENAPTEVEAGKDVTVEVSWEGVPTDGSYKLIVQLENWDVKPGVVYAKEVAKFQSKESQIVTISVPADVRELSGCRYVAAFISQTEGWNKVFAIDRSEKNVTIKAAPHA